MPANVPYWGYPIGEPSVSLVRAADSTRGRVGSTVDLWLAWPTLKIRTSTAFELGPTRAVEVLGLAFAIRPSARPSNVTCAPLSSNFVSSAFDMVPALYLAVNLAYSDFLINRRFVPMDSKDRLIHASKLKKYIL